MSPEKKRLYAVIIITVFSFIIVTGIGNFRGKQLAVSLTGDMVTKSAEIAVEGLDVEKLQGVIRVLDEKHPYYNEMRTYLMEVKKEHNLENLYIFYKDEQEMKWINVVDTKEENDSEHKALGQKEKSVSTAIEKTIRGKAVQGEYQGTLVSSFQGIKDSQGKIFAVLGGDFNAEKLTGFLYLTRYVQMGIIAFTLLLIGSVVAFTKKK